MPNFKVLHISPTFFSDESILGGAERYVDELTKAMSEEIPVDLLSFGPREFQEQEKGRRLIVKRPYFWADQNKLNPIPKSLFNFIRPYSHIHIHQRYNLLCEWALISAKVQGKKVFITDHGGGGRTFLSRYHLQSQADLSLAVSHYNLNKANLNPLKGEVIWGGVDHHHFDQDSQVKREKGKIITLGRILPHKGHHQLLKAIKELSLKVKLTIIGRASDKDYLTHLKTLIKNYSLEESVFFKTNLDDNELLRELHTAELGVFPSTSQGPFQEVLKGEPELFGLAPLEAMATGLPTLISNIGSYPEVAHPEKSFSFQHDSIEDLKFKIENIIKSQETGDLPSSDSWREHVLSKFTWQHVSKRCLKLYRLNS